MAQPLLWVVVPCYREQQLHWVLDNFARQEYANKKLCIVENGEAIGGCYRLGLHADMVVTSREHVSHARNEGMYAVRDRHDDGWVCMWDDDDWYASAYLTEIAVLIEEDKAEVYGKHRHFVAFPNNGLYLFNERNQNKYVEFVHGPTLTFRPEEAVLFHVQREAEEIRWCADMRKLGARVWASSVHNMLYLRYTMGHQHAWNAEDGLVLMASKQNDYYYWLGDTDLDVITGKVPWQSRVLRQEGERTPPPLQLEGPLTKVPVLPPRAYKPTWATVPTGRM
jgi:glycosyltransferase involved in cell wall biosynthesis